VPRLVLVQADRKAQSEQNASRASHRAQPVEGEAAKMLLESNGFKAKSRVSNGQYEFACPFHETDLANGPIPRGHSTNFYLDRTSSMYFCQAASCGEKGNLQTLEKFFGIENDPTTASKYRSLEQRLQEYETQLPKGERRQVFYDKGLNDATIERFRFGYDQEHGYYVLPYLEGRRPVGFRFYNPNHETTVRTHSQTGEVLKSLKYWWENKTDARLYNANDAIGDKNGEVFICEGEQKAALLTQMGYAAVAVPGANIWKPEWSQNFNHAKKIYVCLDNDNPDFHKRVKCPRCGTMEKEDCRGHNPGQDCAMKLMDVFGYRAKNIVLPLTTDAEGNLHKKTDLNEFFMRDGGTQNDFAALALGHGKQSPFIIRTLGEIRAEPPDEAVFLVDQGLLPKGGRLLVTGAPKAGKSIFVENLALSIASGVKFLGQFPIAPNPNSKSDGHRVLLLDRELSERSLYDRLNLLIEKRPGYAAAEDKLLVDHKIAMRLDQPGAANTLISLIQANAADVIILDTAYKFFSGDMESSKNVATALASLDEAIAETGVSVILTHHHRKSGGNQGGKEQLPHPDQVVGSFLWTGWPNGTVLLNFLNRRVDSPFNTVASFVAFRDAAPPEPLALYRDRDSIHYKSVVPYSFDDGDEGGTSGHANSNVRPLTYDEVAQVLLESVPVLETEFLQESVSIFNRAESAIRFQLLDILDRHPDFVRDGTGSREKPYIWKYKHEPDEEPYQEPELELGV
jgi:hypothetical protein